MEVIQKFVSPTINVYMRFVIPSFIINMSVCYSLQKLVNIKSCMCHLQVEITLSFFLLRIHIYSIAEYSYNQIYFHIDTMPQSHKIL